MSNEASTPVVPSYSTMSFHPGNDTTIEHRPNNTFSVVAVRSERGHCDLFYSWRDLDTLAETIGRLLDAHEHLVAVEHDITNKVGAWSQSVEVGA